MRFKASITSSCNRLTDVKGRSSRSEFWFFVILLTPIIVLPQYAIIELFGFSEYAVGIVFGLIQYLLFFSITVRRLNDRNKNGILYTLFYYFISFVFIIISNEAVIIEYYLVISFVIFAVVIFYLYQFCRRGTLGPNRYGEDPTPAQLAPPSNELRVAPPPFDGDHL